MDLLEAQADRDSAINKIERYKVGIFLNVVCYFAQRAVDRKKTRETQNQAIQFMNTEKLSGIYMSHLLISCVALRQSVKRVQELESLANSLSEEVKEKTLAMSHLRRTNR